MTRITLTHKGLTCDHVAMSREEYFANKDERNRMVRTATVVLMRDEDFEDGLDSEFPLVAQALKAAGADTTKVYALFQFNK